MSEGDVGGPSALDQILQQRFSDLKVMFTSVEKVAGLWNGISELHRERWLGGLFERSRPTANVSVLVA